MRAQQALAAAIALSVAACSGGGTGDGGPPGTGTGAASDATAGSRAHARETAASAASPIGNVLVHRADDDGTTPIDGTDVALLFEPDATATLYVQSSEDVLTAHGSWSYGGDELALTFDTEQLAVDVVAPFDLSADEVSLPFRLFDGGGAGESRWERRPVDPVEDMRAVFRAAVLDEESPTDVAGGIERAVAYTQAVIDLDRAAGGARARGRGEPVRTVPVRAAPLANGVEVEYSDGTLTQALLVSWAPASAAPLALSQASLSTDPRVHLDTLANTHTQDDPPAKDALFIVPLRTGRIHSWLDRVFNGAEATGIVGTTADPFDFDRAGATLERRGYQVTRVFDEAACVRCLIDVFRTHRNPGFTLFQSHGSSTGFLLAGDQLSEDDDWDAAHRKFLELQAKLRDAGYASLVETKNALSMMSIETEMKVPQGVVYFAAVGPGFWQWLRDHQGVDFSRGLFYAAACELDDEPAAREAIAARAFFGFKATVSPHVAAAMFHYLVDHLARHTRSAEEAFYNIVRVVNTGEMIYAEDKHLDGVAPTDDSGTTLLFQDPADFQFNGYASDGVSSPLPYALHGWFDTAMLSQTQVWWLMFAARWSEDIDVGVSNLLACNSDFWSQGDYGGLGSPYCNAANDGSLPTDADIGYATYLLTGVASAPTTPPLPRFTLNEGA